MALKPVSNDEFVEALEEILKTVDELIERIEITHPDELHREVHYSAESLKDYVEKDIRYFNDFENYDLG